MSNITGIAQERIEAGDLVTRDPITGSIRKASQDDWQREIIEAQAALAKASLDVEYWQSEVDRIHDTPNGHKKTKACLDLEQLERNYSGNPELKHKLKQYYYECAPKENFQDV